MYPLRDVYSSAAVHACMSPDGGGTGIVCGARDTDDAERARETMVVILNGYDTQRL